MKRDSLERAWPHQGFAGAVAPTQERPVRPVGWFAQLIAVWRAVRRLSAGRRVPDSLAVLPPHLLEDVGFTEALRSMERAHSESQVERFTRASAQLGRESERFGPW